MNWEVGKVYKLRDGGKARIYAVDGAEPYEIHGASMESGALAWVNDSWTVGGANQCGETSDVDLTEEEWVEPTRLPRMLAYRLPGGQVVLEPDSLRVSTLQRVPWLDEPESDE